MNRVLESASAIRGATCPCASRQSTFRRFSRVAIPLLSLSAFALAGCSSFEPPHIAYDDSVPPLPAPPTPADDHPKPLHIPPAWKPALGGKTGGSEAKEPEDRVEAANDAARVQPRRAGYFNAVQVYPFSAGALYQVYASPGQITDIALEQGEQLTGSGPVAAGDTVRWVIGDTESGAGDARRVHILVKPTRPGIDTNLVLNTDRRTYLLELRSREKRYMPSIAWTYPTDRAERARNAPLTPVLPDPAHRQLRYRIEETIPLGGRSSPMTTAAKSTSNSPAGSPRAKCLRSSCWAPAASPNSSIIAPTAMC